MGEDDLKKISRELANIDEPSRLKAIHEKDNVLILIQDTPEELRRLADALERVNVRNVRALIAYQPDEPEETNSSGRLKKTDE